MLNWQERLELLERRNERLESRNRWYRRAASAGVLVAGAMLLLAPAGAQVADKLGTIKAKEIVLMDDAGKSRVALAVDKNGAGLEIKDSQGKTRVVIGEGTIPGLGENPGAGIWIFDEMERPRVGVGVGKDGTGMIVLDEKGKPVGGAGK